MIFWMTMRGDNGSVHIFQSFRIGINLTINARCYLLVVFVSRRFFHFGSMEEYVVAVACV